MSLGRRHHDLPFATVPFSPFPAVDHDLLDLDLDLGLSAFPHFPFVSPAAAAAFPFSSSSFEDDLFYPYSAEIDLLDAELAAIQSIEDRVAALELELGLGDRRRVSYSSEAPYGRRWKYEVEDTPLTRSYAWEAEVRSPWAHGLDRKVRYAAEVSAGGGRKVKWAKEVKGKGWLEPWSQACEWEEVVDDDGVPRRRTATNGGRGAAATPVVAPKAGRRRVTSAVAIDENHAGAVAIRKAFAKHRVRGKRRMLSPHDAAVLIQMTYRTHLARRSQVLHTLRELAVAKARLKEIRALFYNIAYRRRVARDLEERQRFSEKIIVLLLTIDALQGPDYMVRSAKKLMLDELEGMLEVVDPQPPGTVRSLRRRRFNLPDAEPPAAAMVRGVNDVVRIVEEED